VIGIRSSVGTVFDDDLVSFPRSRGRTEFGFHVWNEHRVPFGENVRIGARLLQWAFAAIVVE